MGVGMTGKEILKEEEEKKDVVPSNMHIQLGPDNLRITN